MTAAAVETGTPSEERITFIGKKIADRLKKRGMSFRDLAADWGVSYGTARNAAYWPTPLSEPKPGRIEELERAVDLPVGTLRAQYYSARVNPAYWKDDDAPTLEAVPAAPAPKGGARKATAKKATVATVATRRTTTSATKPPTLSGEGSIITVEPVSEYDEMSRLRRRIGYLENLFVAVAPLLAKGAGVDADKLRADMGLGS